MLVNKSEHTVANLLFSWIHVNDETIVILGPRIRHKDRKYKQLEFENFFICKSTAEYKMILLFSMFIFLLFA